MFTRKDAVWVSLAYRYHNPEWSLERNQEVYGENHNVEGLGANMTVWLETAGEADPSTALLVPERGLAHALGKAKKYLDHRCLFSDEPWFQKRVPTPENIALFLRENLFSERPPAGRWSALEVVENDRWSVRLRSGDDKIRLMHRFSTPDRKIETAFEGLPDRESGLLVRRSEILDAVKTIEFNTPETFFSTVKSRLSLLTWMRVEEPRRRALEIG